MDNSVGAAIRQRREALGWSQGELARRAAMPQPTVSRIEAGRHKPGSDNLRALADALGTTADALLRPRQEQDSGPPIEELQKLGWSDARIASVAADWESLTNEDRLARIRAAREAYEHRQEAERRQHEEESKLSAIFRHRKPNI